MQREQRPGSYLEAGAVIGPTGAYRYLLHRRWAPGGTTALFIMLNPSTADGDRDDPTIRRCVGFARDLGHAAMEVVNLFAYRATNPRDLGKTNAPIGPENDRWITEAAKRADVVICAWGVSSLAAVPRGRFVLDYLRDLGIQPMCLARTAGGQPRHPLYLRHTCVPEPL